MGKNPDVSGTQLERPLTKEERAQLPRVKIEPERPSLRRIFELGLTRPIPGRLEYDSFPPES